jgi:hypothetical protein
VTLNEWAEKYRAASDEERAEIRARFAKDPVLSRSVLPFPPKTREELRDHVTLFVIADQGLDTRDAILAIDALCADARARGFDVDAVLREHLPLASDEDKYGWGTTRALLERNLRQ